MGLAVDNNKQYEKPSIPATIGGVLAGTFVKNISAVPQNFISPKLFDKMGKLSSNLSSDEFKQVEDSIAQALKKTGLDKKGVGIIKATAENSEEIAKIMVKECEANKLAKHLPKFIKDMVSTMYVSQASSGINAFYTFASKKIVLPEKNLILSAFHEAGHAMNANLSTFGKSLQSMRGLMALATPIALIALFKTKKAEGEKPKNKLDKATDFIKNNAGKLTFLCFTPMLLEEGLASIKGGKLAKELLNPELAKRVSKTNKLGFATYAATAALTSLGIYLGTKVKDAIAHKKAKESNSTKAS